MKRAAPLLPAARRIEVATFEDPHALVEAARACRERGIEVAGGHSPHPVHGLEEAPGIPRSRLPVVCFAGGFAGLLLALWFQYWASATDWPLDVGGKPWNSLPAFLPVGFEMTVLLAGLSTAAALLLRSRLWPGREARLVDARATDDRYVLVVSVRDARVPAEEIRSLLVSHGAIDCREELIGEARR
jgi:hypothetical protein